MYDVFCIGNALVDITMNVPDSFILANKLEKGRMTLVNEETQKKLLETIQKLPVKKSPGGSSSNVSLGVACLGGKSLFAGKIGADANGNFFEETLRKRNVKTKLSKCVDSITGSAITFITKDGERTFSTYLGAAATLNKDDLLIKEDTKYLHVEAYLLEDPVIRKIILKIVKKIKEKNTKISLDLSDPNLIKRIRFELEDFLKYVDVVFANEEEAKEFTKKNDVDAAKKLNEYCEIAIVKLGKKGSIIVTKKEQKIIKPKIVKPVNTNGAGDAYAAGFLYGLSKNLSIEDSAKIACFLSKETVLREEASVQESLSQKCFEIIKKMQTQKKINKVY